MSKIALNSNASGTGVFTIESPNSDTDRTLTLPDQSGQVVTTDASGQSLVLPAGTTAQRPASPADGYIRYNTTEDKMEVYNGTDWQTVTAVDAVSASGGTETTITDGGVNYKIHTFTSSGTFTVANGGEGVEYLVLAGAGGGGCDSGPFGNWGGAGGGGAGGYRCSVSGESSGGGGSAENMLTIVSGSYAITVGAGGAGGSNGARGSNGSDSVFSTITSVGGGAGGGEGGDIAPTSGGSGGGSGGYSSPVAGGSGTANQGYNGGAGFYSGGNGSGGGSGGGAGGAGLSGGYGDVAGGPGVASDITGSSVTRAVGGTGAGGVGSTNQGASGAANSGTGGGGSEKGTGVDTGGAGGSGIVIIRYRI